MKRLLPPVIATVTGLTTCFWLVVVAFGVDSKDFYRASVFPFVFCFASAFFLRRFRPDTKFRWAAIVSSPTVLLFLMGFFAGIAKGFYYWKWFVVADVAIIVSIAGSYCGYLLAPHRHEQKA
jgi:hypothetical protein